MEVNKENKAQELEGISVKLSKPLIRTLHMLADLNGISIDSMVERFISNELEAIITNPDEFIDLYFKKLLIEINSTIAISKNRQKIESIKEE